MSVKTSQEKSNHKMGLHSSDLTQLLVCYLTRINVVGDYFEKAFFHAFVNAWGKLQSLPFLVTFMFTLL